MSGFRARNIIMVILDIFMRATFVAHLIILVLIAPTRFKIVKLLIVQFFAASCYFLFSDPNILFLTSSCS
jgi:hypothetical protein